ncbi:MAG: hypothetical protein HKN26_12045 [Acidimicrobiales bacterium]|nr:hypothetical protein [Acidimicrobiales bacterium]
MPVAVIAHAAFTFAMAGFMLAVQLVIYPQFRSVDPGGLPGYAADHARRIIVPLAALAPAEIATAAWLVLDPVDELATAAVFAAGVLLAIGWVATGLWYAPLHGQLQSEPHDSANIDRLITTNWLRTALWLARAGFAAWFLHAAG